MAKLTVPIRGMHCKSCEIMIEKNLRKLSEIHHIQVSHTDGIAHIYCKGSTPKMEDIVQAIQAAGYEVGEKERLPWISNDLNDYSHLILAGGILAILYFAAKGLGIFDLNVDTSNMGFFVVLLVGLVAGVSTCMALVGGLVLGLSARHSELHPEASTTQKFRPHLYFNMGRIGGYAAFGGTIGLLGSAFTPSARTLGLLTVIVGGVMIFLGLKLIEIFPILRDKNIALPKSISKWLGLHKENREYSHKGAIITGALTFFLPCGFTQAMQLYAVSTGSFIQGAIVMALFALGTAPGLIGIGYLSSAFKGQKARLFFMVAGLAVILLGALNINNGKILLGSISATQIAGENTNIPNGEAQVVNMTEDYNGYSPNSFTVQKGRPVKWIIDAKNIYTCASQLIMPKMGIQRNLDAGENIITFTPTETGVYTFSCSMGMYRGQFNVVDESASTGNLYSAAPDQVPYTPPLAYAGASCGSGGGCGCGGGSAGLVASSPPDPSIDLSKAQEIRSEYTQSYGLEPYEFTVEKDKPVKWVISMKEPPAGCMRQIVIRELGVSQPNPDSGEMTVVFQPKEVGDLSVTCAMGMYRATIHVT